MMVGDEMVRIVICDDEWNICNQLRGFLEDYAREQGC